MGGPTLRHGVTIDAPAHPEILKRNWIIQNIIVLV